MVVRLHDGDSPVLGTGELTLADLEARYRERVMDGWVDVTREQTTTPADAFLTDEAIDNYVDPGWDGKS